MQLYENIKKRRLELGLTQGELAKRIGYSDKSMISHIEKGEIDLQQSKILAFAEALKTSPSALMGWEEKETGGYPLDPMEIGERIKEKRKERNLTLEDLSRIAGVSRQTIFRYENGEIKNIPSDKIEAIAKALGVSPVYLMGWEEKETGGYYLDPEVAELAQELHDNPDLRVMLSASRKVSKEDMKTLIKMIKGMEE